MLPHSTNRAHKHTAGEGPHLLWGEMLALATGPDSHEAPPAFLRSSDAARRSPCAPLPPPHPHIPLTVQMSSSHPFQPVPATGRRGGAGDMVTRACLPGP